MICTVSEVIQKPQGWRLTEDTNARQTEEKKLKRMKQGDNL